MNQKNDDLAVIQNLLLEINKNGDHDISTEAGAVVRLLRGTINANIVLEKTLKQVIEENNAFKMQNFTLQQNLINTSSALGFEKKKAKILEKENDIFRNEINSLRYKLEKGDEEIINLQNEIKELRGAIKELSISRSDETKSTNKTNDISMINFNDNTTDDKIVTGNVPNFYSSQYVINKGNDGNKQKTSLGSTQSLLGHRRVNSGVHKFNLSSSTVQK